MIESHPHHDSRESNQSLWLLTAAPAAWLAHFLLCYATAAVWCAKLGGRDSSLAGVRLAIAGYTVVALSIIAVVGWIGYRRHGTLSTFRRHDQDNPEHRHHFVGFAMLLLAGLSAVATLYVALVAVFVETCQ